MTACGDTFPRALGCLRGQRSFAGVAREGAFVFSFKIERHASRALAGRSEAAELVVAQRQKVSLKKCAAIAARRFSAPPDSNRQPDDRQDWPADRKFGEFRQYYVFDRSGAIDRAGGGTDHLQGRERRGGCTLAVTRRKSRAAGKRCSCRRTCGPFRMHISNKHGDKIQQQASTRYVRTYD